MNTRKQARDQIIAAANAERSRRSMVLGNLDPFEKRHLQRAVFKCRQFRLVSDDVLIAAGFNPR